MPQVTLNGKTPVVDWYETHQESYKLTQLRLAKTLDKFLNADTDEAVRMLDMSYANAVISQQCSVEKHEPGWIHWCQTGNIPEYVLYSNQKTRWLNSTNYIHKRNVVRMIHADPTPQTVDKAHAYLAEHFTGLSYMKAAFTLAMLGFTSRMCIDTNVAQVCGIDNYKFNSIDSYLAACDEIHSQYQELDLSKFMTQWVLFDFNRGNHSTHEVWFKQLDTWVDADKGMWRTKF